MEVLGAVMDQFTQLPYVRTRVAPMVSALVAISAIIPEGETIFQIFYQTDPEKVDKLNKIVYAELDKVAKNGPDKGSV